MVLSHNSMNNPAFDFQSLTPAIILDALEHIGLVAESGLTALNSYENRVYQFMDEQRRRHVVKFYRPERWSAEQIIEDHEFSLSLAAESIPVIAPTLYQGRSLHNYQGYLFAVFPSQGGRQYESDNLEHLELVGRFMGRIHQLGKAKTFVHRPTFGLDEFIIVPRQILESTSLLPTGLRVRFLSALDGLIAAVEGAWWSDWSALRLHGDCHPGNILWRDGPLFVDLDDARNGPAVQDLWMLLNGSRSEQLMQLDILLEAYGEFCEFSSRELTLIEPLRAMRMIHYLAWVVRRWHDPAFPASFPWLKEEDFWFRQTAMFIEQTKQLQEPPLQLMPMY
jgi:Ser/Thr protein kinase RdoA (MazF antagonist)